MIVARVNPPSKICRRNLNRRRPTPQDPLASKHHVSQTVFPPPANHPIRLQPKPDATLLLSSALTTPQRKRNWGFWSVARPSCPQKRKQTPKTNSDSLFSILDFEGSPLQAKCCDPCSGGRRTDHNHQQVCFFSFTMKLYSSSEL